MCARGKHKTTCFTEQSFFFAEVVLVSTIICVQVFLVFLPQLDCIFN
jgi:hypothetical protein